MTNLLWYLLKGFFTITNIIRSKLETPPMEAMVNKMIASVVSDGWHVGSWVCANDPLVIVEPIPIPETLTGIFLAIISANCKSFSKMAKKKKVNRIVKN